MVEHEEIPRVIHDGSRQWTVLDRVGGGGTAYVFRARTEQGKVVKIKWLKPDKRTDPTELARFKAEAERLLAANKLDHCGAHFLIGDYEDGNTLRVVLAEQIAKSGYYRGPESCEVLRDIAIKLAAEHPGKGRGDLKPENVIAKARHRGYDISLIDEGSSWLIGKEKPPATGTPEYQAPEHYGSKFGISHKSDIYSLGVMMYEAFAGRRPYDAETTATLRALHLAGKVDVEPLQQQGCPAELEKLILRCLAVDPKARPEAREIADTLERYIVAAPAMLEEGDRAGSARNHLHVIPTDMLGDTAPARRSAAMGIGLVVVGLAILGAFKHAAVKAWFVKPGPRFYTHALSAEEKKAECAFTDGTDYVCVPAERFTQCLTPASVDALCDRLGPLCTRGPDGVLSKLKRSICAGNVPREVYVSTFAMRRDLVSCGEFATLLNMTRGKPGWKVLLETTIADGQKALRARYPSIDGERLYDLFATGSCIDYDEKAEHFSIKHDVKRDVSMLPVQNVSAFGAEYYCDKREQAHLPTEAQFARVRLSAGTLFPNGASSAPPCLDVAYGQVDDDQVRPIQHGECVSLAEDLKGSRPVGSSPVDVVPKFGIRDLMGNVRQWARDGFVEHLRPCGASVCIDPVEPATPHGPHVMVGSAFSMGSWFMYASTRGQYDGSKMDRANGFRCVKTPE